MICSLLLLFWCLEANSAFVLCFLSLSITIFFKCLQVFSCSAFIFGPSLIIHKTNTLFYNCLLKLSFSMLAAVMLTVYGDHCWSCHPISPQFLCVCVSPLDFWNTYNFSQTLQENPLGRDCFYPICMAASAKRSPTQGQGSNCQSWKEQTMKTALELPSSWPLLITCPATLSSGFLSPWV